MMQIGKVRFCALAVSCALGLAGCSGEPGASDIKEAAHRNPQFVMMVAMSANMGGRGGDAQVRQVLDKAVVEKSSCATAQGAPGYVCDFRWGAPQPGGGHQFGQPVKGRFYKTGSEWNVEFAQGRR
jgi:hypothetical protein